jgi:hypothetical protein
VAPKLLIEDGAFFEGDCQMGEPPEGFTSRRGEGDGGKPKP